MSAPPQFEAPSPQELNGLLPAYEVTAFIAKGGMGAVYKAHQNSLERDVAIKILPREFGEDADFRKRFEDEAKAMAKLNHPNLIGVYDFGEIDGMFYIVMEFVNGKSLHHSAHGTAIEQKQTLELVQGICEGLAHAHEAGILHRDIKPANILLDTKKRPKIGDFGLARAADSSEKDGVIFGTPDYTAPEVIRDSDAVDKRSDVFSIGVILYELLTGKLPEKNYVPASQIEDVDPRFDKIIRRATHPSPTLRFADAAAMGRDIKSLREALEKAVSVGIVTQAPPQAPAKEHTPATVTKVAGVVAAPTKTAAPVPAATETGSPANLPPAPAVELSTGPNWELVRNLVIIVILLLAIFGMYKAYESRKEQLAEKQADQDKLEQEQNQALKQQELAERRLRERERRERDQLNLKPPGPSTVPNVKPRELSPLEVLAGLRFELRSGDRSNFPPNTYTRGTHRFFLVEKPMSWQAAAAFAQDHGGQLATLVSSSEKNWLSSKLPKNSLAWLGGGTTNRNRFGWIDGTKWTVETLSDVTGNHVALDNFGTLDARPGGQEFPFFIQWHMDNSRPGSFPEQLKRLKATLKTPEPIYPAGTIAFENRRYLFVEHSVEWIQAAKLAGDAYGHLAVPSEKNEASYLQSASSRALPKGVHAWIGGQHSGRAWSWATGEPWTFGAWAPDCPDGEESSDTVIRLRSGTNGGWDDADPSDLDAASAFIIEWSKDREAAKAGPVVGPIGAGGDFATLRAESNKFMAKMEKTFAADLVANGKQLKWDLDFWVRGLRDIDERRFSPTVNRLKAKVQRDGTIDITKREVTLPARGVEVVRSAMDKEQKLKDAFLNDANKLRLHYLKGLTKQKTSAETAGLTAQIRAINNEVKACGENGLAFLEHMGSEYTSIVEEKEKEEEVQPRRRPQPRRGFP